MHSGERIYFSRFLPPKLTICDRTVATAKGSSIFGDRTLADLLDELGNVPLNRILLRGPLGTATVEDVLAVDREHGLAPELIDGVLVEKAPGFQESILEEALGSYIIGFMEPESRGAATGAGGTLEILPGQVRVPDVCFISRDRLPGGKCPKDLVPSLIPDLAVEFLSPGNTEGEMSRKLRDYFAAGVRLVWYIDHRSRTATVYTAIDQSRALTEDDSLVGGDVLAGFQLPLSKLFAELEL